MAFVVLGNAYVLGGAVMPTHLKKVLIVEDNSDWRLLLSMVIQRAGYDVISAITGNEGVTLATLNHPDLILLDLGLPGMSGDAATAQIKQNPATRNIPVVIQTAFAPGTNVNRAIQAGAVEVLHKPISIAEIQRVLDKYLSAENTLPRAPVQFETRQSNAVH